MATAGGDELRRRARVLRRCADELVSSGAFELARFAGPDTWLGPTATRCHDDLAHVRRRLARAGDDLRRAARSLELEAEQREAAITIPVRS